MILASFEVEDKLRKAWFFQETFLLADISMEVVLGMPFLTFSNADIQFAEKKLTWRSYLVVEALPTTKQVQIIDRRKFAVVALAPDKEAFMVHVVYLGAKMSIHPA